MLQQLSIIHFWKSLNSTTNQRLNISNKKKKSRKSYLLGVVNIVYIIVPNYQVYYYFISQCQFYMCFCPYILVYIIIYTLYTTQVCRFSFSFSEFVFSKSYSFVTCVGLTQFTGINNLVMQPDGTVEGINNTRYGVYA